MERNALLAALQTHLPEVLRWSGAIAKRLRNFNIAVENKSSGSALTDALTLADLTLQELIVAALRDRDPIFLKCRIEAEEKTGDLNRFAAESPYVLSIDPIDGTKQYRDKTANGYCVMIHLRDSETVLYSLVYIPETGDQGTWVEAVHQRVVCGPDDLSRPAREVLDAMPAIDPKTRPDSPRIYLIGFQDKDTANARLVTAAGLEGVPPEEMPGSIYDLLATGAFGGSLIHTPNVYDFPVSLHIARILGGDAVWVQNGEPVNFHEHWLDERADMLRLPGITACSANPQTLKILCELAKDWSPIRYQD
ncbi:inositol monophosphatase family protein [uncultured Gimesia sp.]|uniref:inositol monophosphatase family protein n=1 Tax=uncultured Gimesia sp. TaxID=1678688 RepID=UPI002613DDBC|nr:inositol monophosphatase family protein [uncultured Gimesia sp.]